MRLLLLASLTACAATAHAAPKELGDVAWLRNFDQASKKAEASNKPILILFDEVPGCQTCVRYGQVVLTHPLLVDAAENEFVPLAIYNNVGGHDRAVLKRFHEPTWNNPVVRIVDAKGRPLAPRLAGDYSKGALGARMVAALQKAKRPVPSYLALLAEELSTRRREKAVYSMYCFWTGEVCLGDVEGVVETQTGFKGGKEVVEVTYDPSRISSEALTSMAEKRECGRAEPAGGVRASEKDDKYQLRHTAWRFVPMTPLQASRANTMIGRGQDPRGLFSPRQIALYEAAKERPKAPWPVALGADDLKRAFAAAEKL